MRLWFCHSKESEVGGERGHGEWGAGVNAGCGFHLERDEGSGWGKKELTGGPRPPSTRERERRGW